MGKQAAQISITQQRGKVVVNAVARTPRGQSYIKEQVILQCKSIADPAFKQQMAAAVAILLGSAE